jgi:hypothetical protein
MVYTINHLESLKAESPTSEAIKSQSKCIRLLIHSLSQPNASIDDFSISLVLGLIATETEIWSKVTPLSIFARLWSSNQSV